MRGRHRESPLRRLFYNLSVALLKGIITSADNQPILQDPSNSMCVEVSINLLFKSTLLRLISTQLCVERLYDIVDLIPRAPSYISKETTNFTLYEICPPVSFGWLMEYTCDEIERLLRI